MIKLITVVKRKPGMTRAEFVDYWKHTHARLARDDTDFWSRVRGYVQNYVISSDSDHPDWDGVVELWFDNQAELDAAFGGEATKRGLVADLAYFTDVTSMISVVTEENILYDGKSERILP